MLELVLLELELVVVLVPRHCPSWHVVPVGQRIPVHAHGPHAPVTGSQHAVPVHGLVAHLFITQAGGDCVMSHTWPVSQAGLQVATQVPSTQVLPVSQVTPAQGVTQVKPVKPGFGLHSWLGGQLLAVQGLAMQVPPPTQTWLQPEQGTLKQFSATHLPALGP